MKLTIESKTEVRNGDMEMVKVSAEITNENAMSFNQ